jgi:hypothetical protein
MCVTLAANIAFLAAFLCGAAALTLVLTAAAAAWYSRGERR